MVNLKPAGFACGLAGNLAKDCPANKKKPITKPAKEPKDSGPAGKPAETSTVNLLKSFQVSPMEVQLMQEEIMDTQSPGSPETPEVLNVTEPVPKILSTPLDLPAQLEKELFGSISHTEESSESTQKSWSMSADELGDDLGK